MFFNAPGNPSRLKKTVYLFVSIILGVILSFIAHAFIEIGYLYWLQNSNRVAAWHNGCALPLAIQIALFAIGAVGGFFLGWFWWRKVYIEKVWVKKISKINLWKLLI